MALIISGTRKICDSKSIQCVLELWINKYGEPNEIICCDHKNISHIVISFAKKYGINVTITKKVTNISIVFSHKKSNNGFWNVMIET